MKHRVGVVGLSFVVAACASSPPPAPAPPAPTAPPAAVVAPPAPKAIHDDDFTYLEDVTGEKALAFANAHDAVVEKELGGTPRAKEIEDRLTAIMSSKDKIPGPSQANGKIRNFWTDKDHQRGLWRETTLAEYKKAEPAWTTLIDIDALNKTESASYVYKGADCLYPKYKKCLVSLSKGGGDATIVREFDTDKKEFVKGGFELPEGKHDLSWKDENTIYVGTNFGPGSLTRAGYARTSREWKRGTKLEEAKQIFEVKETDNGGGCFRSWDHKGKSRDGCSRHIDFEHRELSFFDGGKLVKVDLPDDADVSVRDDDVLMRLKSDWNGLKSGSFVTIKLKKVQNTNGKAPDPKDFQVLFAPTAHESLATWTSTKSYLVMTTTLDVKKQVTVWKRANENAPWTGTPLKDLSVNVSVGPYDHWTSDDVWVWQEDFTVPSTLSLQSLDTNKREELKKSPSFFEANGIESTQHFATSKDGTKVPYFEVGKKDRKGPTATLIEAYGGFGLSSMPSYRGTTGAVWLEKGGTFVVANIRGGGEYGPEWHKSAMKDKRQNAFDDLIAVAEDLQKRGVATNKSLGFMGGSNGGLLASVMLTQRPDLWGAIVSRVPLTDMKRYHKLLAGASWMSEYGDPEKPEEWAWLGKYSPFQNIKPGAAYPAMLFTTSTKDDRVHPGHARKMVAKLEAMGYQPLYFENTEGGHAGAADIRQRAHIESFVWSFLGTRLGLN